MKPREMKQYGWLNGPVECFCSGCDWYATFIAVDASVPIGVAQAFAAHDCADFTSCFTHRTEETA
jgi:hypothetical protein